MATACLTQKRKRQSFLRVVESSERERERLLDNCDASLVRGWRRDKWCLRCDFAVNCDKENSCSLRQSIHFQAAFHFDKLTKVKFPKICENDSDLGRLWWLVSWE